MKIVFLDSRTINAGDISWRPIEALGTFVEYLESEPEEIAQRAADADVIITNKCHLTSELISQFKATKLICEAATGYDNIDISAARERNIPVTNCPAYGTMAVAQMVVAHLLNVTNRVGLYSSLNREGYWAESKGFSRWDEPLTELCGKHVSIVGFGAIGQATAHILQAFGMKVSAVTSKPQCALPEGISKVSLEEAFSKSDVVSLSCPLTAENRQFVNGSLLSIANPGLILINTARGGLVDDAAVSSALESGMLGAYCADVLSQEPPRADHPLLSAPRSYITPHIAWATPDARQRIIDMIAESIRAFQQGKMLHVVNAPREV